MTKGDTAYFRAVLIFLAGLLGMQPTVYARAADLQSTHTFSIPAQSLDTALLAFSDQAKVQVLMQGGAKADAPSSGAIGELKALEALAAILRNTGFDYQQIDGETVAIVTAGKPSSKTSLNASASMQPVRMAQSDTSSQAYSGQSSQSSAETVQSGRKQATASSLSSGAKESELRLDEVVVTGTHLHGAEQVGSLVIGISREDIEHSGFTTVSQLIESLPQNFGGGAPQVTANLGIQGAYAQEFSSYNGTSTPSLRGLGDGTLTLLDGHRLSRTGGANGSDISLIPLAAIERVEVLADGASAIYGADAVAGVINVMLRRDYDGIEASAALTDPTRSGGGQQETYSMLAGTHWAGGNGLLSYTGQNQETLFTSGRDFSQTTAAPTSLYPNFHSNALTAYLNQDVAARTSVYLEALYNSRTNNSFSSFSSPDFSYVGFNPGDSKAYTVNGGVSQRAGESWIIGLDLGTSQDKRSQTSGSIIGGITQIGAISNSTDREYDAELHGDGTVVSLPMGPLKAAFGGGARRESFELDLPVQSTNLESHRTNAFAYAELQMPLVTANSARVGLEALEFSLSGRYDHYSDFGGTTNPKIGFSYAPIREVRLMGTYGRSFRAPLLEELSVPDQGLLFTGNDARFASGSALALELFGGNESLRAETSKSWTTSIELLPEAVPGLDVSATYFSYDFADKITTQAGANFFSVPLSDPSLAPFTTFFPSAAQITQATSNLFTIVNAAGPDASVNDVQAIFDARYRNVSVWTSKGVDLHGSYHMAVRTGALDFSVNSSFLTVKERANPDVDLQRLSGQVFGPAKWRVRGGVVWSAKRWVVSGYLNAVSPETDVYSMPAEELGAWITTDLRIGYAFPTASGGWLSGTHASLTVLNVFDRDPPHLSFGSTLNPGIGYDPTNASPFGRLLTLSISKEWGGR